MFNERTLMGELVQRKNCFKLFVSLECQCNKLQFGIRISSIEVRKNPPGLPPFRRSKGFLVITDTTSADFFSRRAPPERAVKDYKRWSITAVALPTIPSPPPPKKINKIILASSPVKPEILFYNCSVVYRE